MTRREGYSGAVKKAPLLPIFLIVLVNVFSLTLVIPLLAIYAETFGASPLAATLLVSVFAFCQLFSGPLLGRLSDRMGRKPLLLVSQVGTFLGLLLMAGASSLPVLYLARIIDGVTAGNLSLAQAYISDHTTPENRTRSFAIIGVAFGVGFFLGPWVTGYLVRYGLRAPILLAAAMSLTSVLCTAVLLPGGRPPVDPATIGPDGQLRPRQGRLASLRARPALWSLWTQFLLFSLAFSLFTSGFALFAERRFTWQGRSFGPREIGYLFAYSGFLGIILQGGLMGRLVRRVGEANLARAGFVAAGVAYCGLAVARGVPHLVVVASISAFGNGVLRPVLTGQVSKAAGPREQGAVLGINQSLASLASVLAPPLSGLLITHQHLSAWALCAAFVCALGVIMALRSGQAPTSPASVQDSGSEASPP